MAPLVTTFGLSWADDAGLHYYDEFVHWGLTSNRDTYVKKINDDNFNRIDDWIEVKIVFGLKQIPISQQNKPAELFWSDEAQKEV